MEAGKGEGKWKTINVLPHVLFWAVKGPRNAESNDARLKITKIHTKAREETYRSPGPAIIKWPLTSTPPCAFIVISKFLGAVGYV